MEVPESSLIRKTLVLREMDLPPQIQLTKRSMLRWFALSFGLLNEQESRVTVLHILDSLFYFLFTEKKNPSTLELQAFMKNQFSITVSEKLIRYHLNKLIDLHLLHRKQNKYHINNHPYADRDDFVACFDYWIKQSTERSLANIQTVVARIVDNYKSQKPIVVEPIKLTPIETKPLPKEEPYVSETERKQIDEMLDSSD
ncbi:MAG: hypothetical protein Q7S92_04065 [Candidatus Diapherotrites archaeon]|nr:hypothetical protein [Candidatus Diapherotrites archaeon]